MLAAARENPDPFTQLPDLGQFSDPDPLIKVEVGSPPAETLKATVHVRIHRTHSLIPSSSDSQFLEHGKYSDLTLSSQIQGLSCH